MTITARSGGDGKAPIVGKTGTVPYRSLLIAQDTGGGIMGAVRADIYWGDDADAEELAGRKNRGRGRGRHTWAASPATLGPELAAAGG